VHHEHAEALLALERPEEARAAAYERASDAQRRWVEPFVAGPLAIPALLDNWIDRVAPDASLGSVA
jgi:hypothetical protein